MTIHIPPGVVLILAFLLIFMLVVGLAVATESPDRRRDGTPKKGNYRARICARSDGHAGPCTGYPRRQPNGAWCYIQAVKKDRPKNFVPSALMRSAADGTFVVCSDCGKVNRILNNK